jgi:hypothetical protein
MTRVLLFFAVLFLFVLTLSGPREGAASAGLSRAAHPRPTLTPAASSTVPLGAFRTTGATPAPPSRGADGFKQLRSNLAHLLGEN